MDGGGPLNAPIERSVGVALSIRQLRSSGIRLPTACFCQPRVLQWTIRETVTFQN